MSNSKSSGKILAAGFAMSAVSGVLLFLSFPSFEISQLAWFALVPLFVALMKFAPSWKVFGAYCGLTSAVWLAGMIVGIPAGYQFLYAGPVVLFIVVLFLTGWLRKLVQADDCRYFSLIVAPGFVAIEYLRQLSPFGTFASLGLTQYRHPEFIQIASLFGVFGVSLMIVLVNCGIALIAAHPSSISKIRTQLMGVVAVVIALLVANQFLLRTPIPQTGHVKVAAVQLGYAPEDKDHGRLNTYSEQMLSMKHVEASNTIIDILAPMTEDAARQGARLVVWPEVVLGTDPEKTPQIGDRLKALAMKANAYIVAPWSYYTPENANDKLGPHFNGATVVSPDGRFVGRYLKQHRVTAFGIEKGPVGNVSKPIITDVGKLGLMICYDADYMDVPNNYYLNGADIYILPSHDLARFISKYHPSMLMFRALEHRRSLVKSDIVNGTLIADPKGFILASPPPGLNVSAAEVPLTEAKTPYIWLSWAFGMAMTIIFIITLFFARTASMKQSAAG